MTRWRLRFAGVLLVTLTAGSMANAAQASDAAAMIAEVVRTGSVIVPGIRFDTGQAAPTAASERSLAEVHALLSEHTEWTFEVQVHTDESGDAQTDRALSDARAASIVAWLTVRGIPALRLVPKGYGSSKPLRVAPAADPSLQHRRVELRKLNEE